MNIEGIVAVVGFALAAFQILPRWRQLDLSFRFRWLDGVVVSACVIALLYLQFFPVFAKLGWSLGWGLLSKWGFTPDMAASIAISLTALFLFFHMRRPALQPYRVARFARLVDELIQAKEYPALFTILDRYFVRLWEIAQGQNPFARMRRWAMRGRYGWDHEEGRPDFTEIIIMMGDEMVKPEEERKPIKEIGRVRNFLAPKLGRLIPMQRRKQDAARAVLNRVFGTEEVLRELVLIRPEMVVPVLQRREKHYEFLDPLLRQMLRTPGSALYRQVSATQVVEKGRWYRIEPPGGLLDSLVGDAEFAKDHGAWQPIAQEALVMFTELRRDQEHDPYNVSYDERFREEGRWNMAFFIVVHYFDIMVSRALYQGEMHHMWLSYFASFTERICENYKPAGQDYDANQEFPTRYSFLLYQIFSALVDWVQAVREMPKDQANIELTEIDAEYNEEYIPKAAVRATARALRLVLTSPTIEQRFKNYIADMVFHLYFDLRQHGPRKYADLLLFFLTHDGCSGRNRAYGRALAEALEESDTFFVMQYRELEEAVRAYNGEEPC